MTAVWPPSLPTQPLVDGYEERTPDTILRTEMDAGEPKQRRRFSAAVAPFRAKFDMTTDQVATLVDFVDSTIAGGALRFQFTHPRTGQTVEVRFTDQPSIRSNKQAPELWRVECPMEVMP